MSIWSDVYESYSWLFMDTEIPQYYFEKYVFHSSYLWTLVLEREFWIYLIALLVISLVLHLKLLIDSELGVHTALSGLEGAVSSADHYS